jgi:hypothetical protein
VSLLHRSEERYPYNKQRTVGPGLGTPGMEYLTVASNFASTR